MIWIWICALMHKSENKERKERIKKGRRKGKEEEVGEKNMNWAFRGSLKYMLCFLIYFNIKLNIIFYTISYMPEI